MEDLLKNKLEALYLSGEREFALARPSQAPTPTPSMEGTPMSPSDPQSQLDEVRTDIGDCQRCRLCEERTNIVFGVGNPQASLMFVGEAPGRDEDKKGEPFVGRAGKLLTKIIEAMKFKREDVYIANVVKCRPPDNRNPAPDEIQTCEPYLLRQIEIIRPQIIVCLGTFAAQLILQTEEKIGVLRSNFHSWPSATVKAKFETSLEEGAIQVMPTYHPAFLLRNPNMKKPVWDDMKKVLEKL